MVLPSSIIATALFKYVLSTPAESREYFKFDCRLEPRTSTRENRSDYGPDNKYTL